MEQSVDSLDSCDSCHQKIFAEKFVRELIEKITFIEESQIPAAILIFCVGICIGIFCR